MKILIFSDTHGSIQPMLDAVLDEKPDQIIHLGDHVRDADLLANQVSCPVARVTGNCDLMETCSDQLILDFDGVRLFLTHGHRYGVKSSLLRLAYAAMEVGAHAALFGHTHCPLLQDHGDITLLNPGACSSYSPTYGVIQIIRGNPSYELKRLE